MLRVVTDEAARSELTMSLDELAHAKAPAACWPPRWRPRSTCTWPPSPSWSTNVATGWCAATVTPQPARLQPGRAGRGRPPEVDDRRVDPHSGQR